MYWFERKNESWCFKVLEEQSWLDMKTFLQRQSNKILNYLSFIHQLKVFISFTFLNSNYPEEFALNDRLRNMYITIYKETQKF